MNALLLSAAILAAPLIIDFEGSTPLPAVDVYDTWEQSPFRTGRLRGNFAVLDNHLADTATNRSAKILGIQRSRFGSNTFGVRIELPAPLVIENAGVPLYAHVMIHKPVEGRIMLIGLGKRADRPEQRPDVEQFWAYPLNDVKAGQWNDAVFSIRCNPGVEIHSIVVVPHCEAPHSLAADFAAYVDEILFNDSPEPRFSPPTLPADVDTPRTAVDEITVSQDNRNGEILLAETGEPVAGQKVAAKLPLKIKMNPSNGFTCGGVIVHHKSGRRQTLIDADRFNPADSTITLDPALLDGDLLLEGLFTELRP